MLHLEGGLEQDETLFGILEIDAAAVVLFDDGFVVRGGLVTEDGKAEAVLAFEGAVATAVVAAVPGEDGGDVAFEAEGAGRRSFVDFGCRGGGEAGYGYAD